MATSLSSYFSKKEDTEGYILHITLNFPELSTTLNKDYTLLSKKALSLQHLIPPGRREGEKGGMGRRGN